MRKFLISESGKKCKITSNLLEREFITACELSDEVRKNYDFLDSEMLFKNGYYIPLSETIRNPETDEKIRDYINSLGDFSNLTILPSMCSFYDILAMSKNCDSYIIFTVYFLDN